MNLVFLDRWKNGSLPFQSAQLDHRTNLSTHGETGEQLGLSFRETVHSIDQEEFSRARVFSFVTDRSSLRSRLRFAREPAGQAEGQWPFSAHGSFLSFTRRHDESSDVAWTTNLDICQMDLRDEQWITRCLTCDNLVADTDPSYSPRDEEVLLAELIECLFRFESERDAAW